MQYPQFRQELLSMMEEDQRSIRAYAKAYRDATRASIELRRQIRDNTKRRIVRVLQILQIISVPTVEKVGWDGSQAISVLALHAQLADMKLVLAAFKKAQRVGRGLVYFEAIPYLTDRVLITERKKQKYGTQWMLGSDGKFFLPPVVDFAHLNDRRMALGLGRSRRPISLIDAIPGSARREEATRGDQRQPTDDEYREFLNQSLV